MYQKNLISFPCQMQSKTFEFQFPHFSCDIQNSFSCLTSQVTVACLIFNFQTSIRLSNWNYESVEMFGDNLGKLPVRTWQLVNPLWYGKTLGKTETFHYIYAWLAQQDFSSNQFWFLINFNFSSYQFLFKRITFLFNNR